MRLFPVLPHVFFPTPTSVVLAILSRLQGVRPTAGSEFVGYPRVVEYSTCGSTASIWLRLLVSLWCLSHKLLRVDDITLTQCEQVSVNGLERGQLPMATPVRSHPRYFGTKTQLK